MASLEKESLLNYTFMEKFGKITPKIIKMFEVMVNVLSENYLNAGIQRDEGRNFAA